MAAKCMLNTLPVVLLILGTVLSGVHTASEVAMIYVSPPVSTAPPGQYFTINLTIADVTGLYDWEVKIRYDLEFLYTNDTMIKEGPFLKDIATTIFLKGLGPLGISLGCHFLEENKTDGSGTLATITFRVEKKGQGTFTLSESKLLDLNLNLIPHTTKDGSFVCVSDVAVTDVTVYPTLVRVGESAFINVTVENQGNFTEAFNVTAYYNNTAIETKPVASLSPGNSTTLTFNWTTTGVSAGEYAISANATVVEGETNTTNNELIDGKIEVSTGGPRAAFTYSPPIPIVGKAVTFDASSSTPDGSIISYSWDFGDGTVGPTTMGANHTYTKAGNYNVTLTITDNEGLTDTETKIVSVKEAPPADIVPYVAAVLMLMVVIAVVVYVKTKKKHPE